MTNLIILNSESSLQVSQYQTNVFVVCIPSPLMDGSLFISDTLACHSVSSAGASGVSGSGQLTVRVCYIIWADFVSGGVH